MTVIRVWLTRLAGLFRRSARDRALDAEMRAHLDDLTDDLIDSGLSRAEAEAAARRAFGGVDQIKEAYRDQRGWPLIDSLGQDVRMARRAVTARPGSTMLIVAGLGLGIGVSMGFFTIVNAICLRGLPIPDPDRVLFLSTRNHDESAAGISYQDFVDLRQSMRAFEGLGAYTAAPLGLADEYDAPARVAGCYVSTSAFPMLGTAPIAGRALQPDDDRPGVPLTALIGDAIWASRYHRDPTILGRTIRINGVNAAIVGVMPDGFHFPGQADLWLPLSAAPGLADAPRTQRSLAVFGRLRDTASPVDAQAELQAAQRRLEAEFPASHGDIRLESVLINDHFNGTITEPVWIAFLTAGLLVLLVACANVANVLLARLATRSREVAVRLALGATRARVVRQLLIESACLAALGGAAGLTFAFVAVRLLAWSYPASSPLPYWIDFTIDGRVLATLVATCTVSVLVFGLVPALQSARIGVNGVLKDGGRQTAGARRTRFWTATFLAIEFALTLVLLANVSMAVRQELVNDQPGIEIDPQPLLVAHLTLPPQRYSTEGERRRFHDGLRTEIARVGNVSSMTSSARVPPSHERRGLMLPWREPREPDALAYSTSVGPRFFGTLGVPLVAGRDLTIEDEQPGHEGVVVNQRFVDLFFAGRPPVGQRMALRDPQNTMAAPAWRTVVGVIPNLRDGNVPEPIAYIPDQDGAASTALVLRTTGDPAAASQALRHAVAGLDRDLPLDRVAPLSDVLHDASWNGRVSADMLLTIATIAFLLAVVGLYAVIAQSVTQRTPEIGIRMALGASSRAVVWLVLRRAFAYVAFGFAASLPCTYFFERIFVSATSGEHPLLSPITFAPVVVLLIVVTLVATAWPAARAARIAPATALRQD
jgi:putative ABC transport system permease protein